MMILGLLSEFSLPEVLLSIGQRTGRLRLYDVPRFGLMQIEMSQGKVFGLEVGGAFLTEATAMVSELSPVMETGLGMFEFSTGEIRAAPLFDGVCVEKFIMLLAVYVDERIREKKALIGANPAYVLANSPPSTWMEAKLLHFFEDSKPFLSEAIRADELAASVGVGRNTVRLNLTNLSESGLVRLVDKGQAKAATAPRQL